MMTKIVDERSEKVTGISKITNKNTLKSYIGQSIHCGQRFDEHCNNSPAQFIDDIIKIEGINNFTFEVLKQVDKKELSYWEDYYIIKYNTFFPNGYNRKWNTSEEMRQGIKMKVDQDLLEEETLLKQNKDMSMLTGEEIIYIFNYRLMDLYLRFFYISYYDKKKNKYILPYRQVSGKFLENFYLNISYNTLLKYLKILKELGFIISENKEEYSIVNIKEITKYISKTEYDIAGENIILLWFIKYTIDRKNTNVFFSIDFRWISSMNDYGSYHAGKTLTKTKNRIIKLKDQGLISFSNKTSDYKMVINIL